MQSGYMLRNRYRIQSPLSAGGFGETYLALDEDYPGKRQVVVKHLKPRSNDSAVLQIARRLFETEAMTLAKLGERTERLPTLYAHFEEGGEFYLVQEYIEGHTLTQELAVGKLSEAQTIEIIQNTLTGLKIVHGQNIIHRDLKPDNIIRRASDRQLVLIDFGAVKAIRQATLMTPNPTTLASIGIGTGKYTPSEQAMGYPKQASDIYALGAIGIQCLTGETPDLLFDEDRLEFSWRHLCQVSDRLATVLDKMLQPRYLDRYANATEALDALDRALLLSPNISTPVSQPISQPNLSETILSSPPSRRSFLKMASLGSIGVISIVSAIIAKSVLSPNRTTNTSKGSTSPTPIATKDHPRLTAIEFTSLKLNNQGQIIAQPKGTAQVFQEDLDNGISLAMVKITPGKFNMGSPAKEQNRQPAEDPQHQVNVPEFYLGQTLVTQAQWQQIMGNNPSKFSGGGKLPVDYVSWLDAMNFCQKLSQKTGRNYRLPTEAEWEYACRAGTTTPFAYGEAVIPAVVNYNSKYPYREIARAESRQKTTPVGTFAPNPFGLYDMHGNLCEWCLDRWSDNYQNAPTDGSPNGIASANLGAGGNEERIRRGGSWDSMAGGCRTAMRYRNMAADRFDHIGLRVAWSPATTA
jgi:eukaryotic-like serine/threonine-protein kinase